MAKELNIKQLKFVELLKKHDGNATKAYAEAYGVSEESAGKAGHRLLKNVEILAAINSHKAEVRKAFKVEREWVLRKLKRQADFDLMPFAKMLASGTVKIEHIAELPAEARKLIKSIRTTKHGIDVEFIDRQAALFKLGMHTGAFEPEKGEENDPNKAGSGGRSPAFQSLVERLHGEAKDSEGSGEQ